MEYEEMAATLWKACNKLRYQPNYKEFEATAQAIDKIAMELARLAGTSFDEIAEKHDLYGGIV